MFKSIDYDNLTKAILQHPIPKKWLLSTKWTKRKGGTVG